MLYLIAITLFIVVIVLILFWCKRYFMESYMTVSKHIKSPYLCFEQILPYQLSPGTDWLLSSTLSTNTYNHLLKKYQGGWE